ncbi:DNA repair protein rad16 [Colletotrichum truncatum]|uniref:DNA repair protein rad16 n=1 Tax=Colletotrichum truncatum TaxID=5467 RepID=A0ACC3ZHL3_COLTU|nr:DNA repair protein rad16 [Colletotrichum truncatum]KAF6786655.1 DNA repair protein rad16 [Colletotrichum truncatum]
MTGRRGRGRPSLAGSLASTRANSPSSASTPAAAARTGRVTRSASAKNLTAIKQPVIQLDQHRTPAKEGRGKPGQAPSLANDSVSSAPSATASADFTSASEDSTPATSNVATPAPSVSTGNGLRRTARSRRSNPLFEIQLPTAADHSRERALRRSEYSLKPQTKRKRFDVGDSDDEEEEYSDTSPDAIVARRLQNEENRKGTTGVSDVDLAIRLQQEEYDEADSLIEAPSEIHQQRGRRSLRSLTASNPAQPSAKDIVEADTDDEPLAARARRGRGRSSNISAPAPKPAAKRQKGSIADSDDDELAGPMEVDDIEDFAIQDSDSEEEIDENPRRSSTKTVKKAVRQSRATTSVSATTHAALPDDDSDGLSSLSSYVSDGSATTPASADSSESDGENMQNAVARQSRLRRAYQHGSRRRGKLERNRLEHHHPEIKTMWEELKALPPIRPEKIAQPAQISRQLKPFQLEGVAWMIAMEKTDYRGGLLGDEMGLGKTIQAVSLIMSDYPAKLPSLVLVPPVALMQWQSEIAAYTDGTLKTFVYHGSLSKTKQMTLKELKQFDVIMMSYNSLESMYRKQEKGFTRKDGIHKEESLIHKIDFHRVILDEAHSIKVRTTMTAKACFALKTEYRWCLTGTPLQNRIGEFFSLLRFLEIKPYASYLCKQCPCAGLEWNLNDRHRCNTCGHAGMQHVSVFNQELLNPIQKFGNFGKGREAFQKLRLMTDRIMLRRLKKDHTNSMELPVKEIYVNRQFFGEVENDFANSIMTNGQRKFETYVAQGVLLNNYANIFGLIMQMRQVADHPDLILKKNAEGGQNTLVCCICDEPAEDAIKSRCKHDFCRACARSYLMQSAEPDCPQCHIGLAIDLEQPEIEQDEVQVKKSSIINRIKMENWTSSSKIELLVHELHRLRSDNASHKSIIFSQFSSMLQLIEWRLRRAGITTVMLDGSMNPAQRQASINHFMTKPEVECFLVSLKAGGVALNLTEASRVFIVDPWWNPAAEWQSADRCHRIGQTRPCTITRLCIEDSVESRMVLIQEKKTNMINSTVNADEKAMESLSPEDMQFLFRGS